MSIIVSSFSRRKRFYQNRGLEIFSHGPDFLSFNCMAAVRADVVAPALQRNVMPAVLALDIGEVAPADLFHHLIGLVLDFTLLSVFLHSVHPFRFSNLYMYYTAYPRFCNRPSPAFKLIKESIR